VLLVDKVHRCRCRDVGDMYLSNGFSCDLQINSRKSEACRRVGFVQLSKVKKLAIKDVRITVRARSLEFFALVLVAPANRDGCRMECDV
jgi:hypothetical protein